jgi:dihydroxyacetone kinase-like protein
MPSIKRTDLDGLFKSVRDAMVENRDRLIELDGKVGDGDLGLTMGKAFTAAHDAVVANHAATGGAFLAAGLAAAKAAPSTMGTLMATGLMRGGKALEGADSIATPEMARFWRAFLDGVMERGKAKRGEKTLVDVLAPVAEALEAAAARAEGLTEAMTSAAAAAATGLEATKGMTAQHGKAACFQEKTIGIQDAGATAAFILVDAMRDFVQP